MPHPIVPHLAPPLALALAAAGFFLRPLLAAAQSRYETTVSASGEKELPEERATSTVSHGDLERRLPGSTAEALRYEAGVFVQSAGDGLGDVFIRGLTGARTLILFDGIRLNNSTAARPERRGFRFPITIDPRGIDTIEVLRGGGSTREGSDALGGVVAAHPVSVPILDPGRQDRLVRVRLMPRASSADREMGARLQLEAAFALPRLGEGTTLGFIGGAGARRTGPLESAGSVENPYPDTPAGRYPYVPRFDTDGRTQLGTGFGEVTADGRLVLQLPSHSVTLAAYLYRQYDAPRTDQCPPPTASYNTCLTTEERFRELVYAAWEGRVGRAARNVRVALSYQQHHERQRLDYPRLATRWGAVDDVRTAGLTARGITERLRPRDGVSLEFIYGLDTYVDQLGSSASLGFTDLPLPPAALKRGQHLDGSWYVYGGAFADGELVLGRRVTVRAGTRLSWFAARAPQDAESGSPAIARSWVPVVGHVGLEVRPHPALQLLANVDHSFRAPNLDDLTGRASIGPGYQLENPDLGPERATTFEAGARLRTRAIAADLWLFETLLHDAMVNVDRGPDACPPDLAPCRAAWGTFKLENAPALSEVRGVEAAVRVLLPEHASVRATLGYAWGEGPRIGVLNREPSVMLTGERIPLSRIPPLHGSVELDWSHPMGLSLGGVLRWAGPQDRLSIEDYKDGRIPKYGTPGFAVVDARLAVRVGTRARFAAVFENLFDTAYRYHGSAVNGPARGVILTWDWRLL